MQFIVSKKEFIPPVIAPDIIETLGDDYEIWTYEDYERLPPLLVGVYSYSAIPKCLAPLSTQGLVKSGVFRLQREFVPGLYGNGAPGGHAARICGERFPRIAHSAYGGSRPVGTVGGWDGERRRGPATVLSHHAA